MVFGNRVSYTIPGFENLLHNIVRKAGKNAV